MTAWRRVYDELATERYPSLVAYASLLTASADEAESVTQASLVRVFGRLRPPSTLEDAEAAVRREMARRAAGRRSAPRASASPHATWRGETAATWRGETAGTWDPQVDEGREAAHERLRALDRVTRACVVLRHADELPVAEIAERLRISPDAVRGRLADAGDHLGGMVDTEAIADDIVVVEVPGERRRP